MIKHPVRFLESRHWRYPKSGEPSRDCVLTSGGQDMLRSISMGLVLAIGVLFSHVASAEPVNMVGPDACKKCHKAEVEVWDATNHAKSFKSIHKSKTGKGILKAVGERSMKRADTCATCHYTYIEGKAKAGPSCESCHGPAQEWLDVHNEKTNDNRIADAIGKGMIHSSMLFDIASNCMSCHGLANPVLEGDTAATMLGAGHPLNPDFELVEYSQGQIRHRFYPPDTTLNKEMTDAQKSVYYLVGQAAALVSATDAISKTSDAKYVEAQTKRIEKAKSVLSIVAGSVPEAQALLDGPSMDAGRAFGEAIKGKDFTGDVGSMLPTTYK